MSVMKDYMYQRELFKTCWHFIALQEMVRYSARVLVEAEVYVVRRYIAWWDVLSSGY